MKFPGKLWLNIKSHPKKLGFTLFAENANSEKVRNTVKIWSTRTLSEIFEFSILGIEQNKKIGNFESFLFFFLIHFITLNFCLSSCLSFLNLKLQLLL